MTVRLECVVDHDEAWPARAPEAQHLGRLRGCILVRRRRAFIDDVVQQVFELTGAADPIDHEADGRTTLCDLAQQARLADARFPGQGDDHPVPAPRDVGELIDVLQELLAANERSVRQDAHLIDDATTTSEPVPARQEFRSVVVLRGGKPRPGHSSGPIRAERTVES